MSLKNKRTSVDLSEIAQKIKEKYIYLGLKNILSAGLILFDKQSQDDKLTAIGVASDAINPNQLTAGEQRLQKISNAISFTKEVKNSEQVSPDVRNFCDKLLDILREPSLAEDMKSTLSPDLKTIRRALRGMIEAERHAPGTIIKILSEEDSARAAEFRKAVGPELIKKKVKKRG